MSTRNELLLSAPVVPTLVRLSAPGLLLVAFQSMVSIGDTYVVGRLGTAPLAGLALVFPLVMLLQMTSAGAMGGGVSSAISRALGAGDARSARRLVVHALVIALEFAQGALGYRSMELADMAANTLGVAAGWGAAAVLPLRWRKA